LTGIGKGLPTNQSGTADGLMIDFLPQTLVVAAVCQMLMLVVVIIMMLLHLMMK
jgi:hypothetical protein